MIRWLVYMTLGAGVMMGMLVYFGVVDYKAVVELVLEVL